MRGASTNKIAGRHDGSDRGGAAATASPPQFHDITGSNADDRSGAVALPTGGPAVPYSEPHSLPVSADSLRGGLSIPATPAFCPSCGFNIAKDTLIEDGRWSLSPRLALYNGEHIKLTPQQTLAMHTIAAARGRWVRYEVLLNRISDSEDINLAAVIISQIRRKLRVPIPFETARLQGARWLPQSLHHTGSNEAECLAAPCSVHNLLHASEVPHG